MGRWEDELAALTVPEEWGIDTSSISSFQVYAPFYEPGQPISSILDRRQALVGWTSVSIDIREVLAAMVLDDNPLDVALYDSSTRELLTESRPGVAEAIEGSFTIATEQLDISGLQMDMRSVLPGDQRLDDGPTSTSTASRRSTTRTGTPPATTCSEWWRLRCATRCATAT